VFGLGANRAAPNTRYLTIPLQLCKPWSGSATNSPEKTSKRILKPGDVLPFINTDRTKLNPEPDSLH
jgi:hypothetical protein